MTSFVAPPRWSYAWRRDIYALELADRYRIPLEQARRIAVGRRLQPDDPTLSELRARRDVRLPAFVQTAEGARVVQLDLTVGQSRRLGRHLHDLRQLAEARPGLTEQQWMDRIGRSFRRRWRRAAPITGIELGDDRERSWQLVSDPRAALALVETTRGLPPGELIFESGPRVRRRTNTPRRAA